MATSQRFRDLRLDTGAKNSVAGTTSTDKTGTVFRNGLQLRGIDVAEASTNSQDNTNNGYDIGTTGGPTSNLGEDVEVGAKSLDVSSGAGASSFDQYFLPRRTSIVFDQQITLDSGHRQHMDEPLQKPAKSRPRGRSLLQALSDEKAKSVRGHSESDRTHYDPLTGQPLPKYAKEHDENQPHVGELRHPLLQSTIDSLARESQTDLTTPSTMSTVSKEAYTPRHEQDDLLSPIGALPVQYAASYEETSQWQRKRRVPDRSNTFDFPRRNGSMRTAMGQSSRTGSRRSTSSSTKSPASAASSWLRGFSVSSVPDSVIDSPAPDAEGQTIGDSYVLGRQIGFGGFSTIHEVTQMMDLEKQRKLAAKVVLKTVQDKSAEDNEQLQAEFGHEVELWRLLHHRHILPLESVYHTDDATYCFIPLNTGGTLFDLVRSNRAGVPIDLAKRYSYQLALAIRYLHGDARVAHRDIKLENCLLDVISDEVRLCDFGMAEWISGDDFSSTGSGPPSPSINAADRPPQRNIGPSETSSSAFAGGSLDYAAPETLRIAMSNTTGRSIVSPAVDLWAFGVCVYTMVVGSRPFYHSFEPRISAAILAGDWNREKLQAKGGQDVFDLVQHCLDMDAEKRWNAEEVLSSRWLRDLVDANEDRDDSFGSEWKL